MSQIPCLNLISIQIIKYYKINEFSKISLQSDDGNLSKITILSFDHLAETDSAWTFYVTPWVIHLKQEFYCFG